MVQLLLMRNRHTHRLLRVFLNIRLTMIKNVKFHVSGTLKLQVVLLAVVFCHLNTLRQNPEHLDLNV